MTDEFYTAASLHGVYKCTRRKYALEPLKYKPPIWHIKTFNEELNAHTMNQMSEHTACPFEEIRYI